MDQTRTSLAAGPREKLHGRGLTQYRYVPRAGIAVQLRANIVDKQCRKKEPHAGFRDVFGAGFGEETELSSYHSVGQSEQHGQGGLKGAEERGQKT